MKVCVYGLWHLGAVTAACLADAGFVTVGLADDIAEADRLSQGIAPLFEPKLDALLIKGLKAGTLSFSADAAHAAADADVIWVTYDMQVDEDDRADIGFVTERIRRLFPFLRDRTTILVSSQLPVGSIAKLEALFLLESNGRDVTFACSPENLRLGKAIEVFCHPERIIVGIRASGNKAALKLVFAPFSNNIIWTGVEAAELSKHAINAFLATCVTFMNEIATLAEQVGANASEVEKALRSEPRIGQRAYIRPGTAFAGGTLARDVQFLCEIANKTQQQLPLIGSILASNSAHSQWPLRRLTEALGRLDGRRIAVLGLSYKPGTDSIRRSLAVELVNKLVIAGASVVAFDPKVTALPDALPSFASAQTILAAIDGADAAVVMTEWPEFSSLTAEDVVAQMANPLVIDINGFLHHLIGDGRIRFLSIGRPT